MEEAYDDEFLESNHIDYEDDRDPNDEKNDDREDHKFTNDPNDPNDERTEIINEHEEVIVMEKKSENNEMNNEMNNEINKEINKELLIDPKTIADEIAKHFDGLLNFSGEQVVMKERYVNHSTGNLMNNDNFTNLYTDIYQSPMSTLNVNNPEIYNCINCGEIDSIKSVLGVNVCTKCGVEKGPEISEDMECQYSGMAVGDNSATARSGLSNNKLLFQSNFSTKIVGNHTSYNLKQINNVWTSLDYTERTLLKIFKKISDNCRQKGIPNNVVSYTQVLYKQVYDEQKKAKKGTKGSRADKLEGLIAGCIYYSCKAYGINRSHQEIAEIACIDKKEVSYGCKLFFKLMHDKINLNDNNTSYNDFLERYASQLDLNDDELEIIKEVCENIVNLEILDNSKPSTMAAISIYLCANLYNFEVDKKDIAEKCHTTEPTLNKNYKILIDYVDKLIA